MLVFCKIVLLSLIRFQLHPHSDSSGLGGRPQQGPCSHQSLDMGLSEAFGLLGASSTSLWPVRALGWAGNFGFSSSPGPGVHGYLGWSSCPCQCGLGTWPST